MEEENQQELVVTNAEVESPVELAGFKSLGLSDGEHTTHAALGTLDASKPVPVPTKDATALVGQTGEPNNAICVFATCPVEEWHDEGPYYHNGVMGDQSHHYFKGSNPPPHVWAAFGRVQSNRGSTEDDEVVSAFWACHVYPYLYIPIRPDVKYSERDSAEGETAWQKMMEMPSHMAAENQDVEMVMD